MASFELAYNITLGHEGGYSNDPDDAGGETYKGVSRRYHPDWEGWAVIDAYKANNNPKFPECLDIDGPLQDMIKKFYKQNYWNLFWGDTIPNQFIVNELFDTSVNMGISRAIKYLQIGLNVLNRNGKLYPDIVEDGKFGYGTLKALNAYLSTDSPELLYKIMNVLQGAHYIEYMKKDPKQEKSCRGWFSRIDFIKK